MTVVSLMSLIKDPSRLNIRAEFGTIESIENEQGVSKPTFVSQFSCWCAIWMRTINQTYQLTGTELSDTQTLVIRHNSNVNDSLMVRVNEKTYHIESINSDESGKPISYDTLIVKEVTH